MKKESQIYSKKRLLITNERLGELQNLLSKYCTHIDWKATLTDGTTVTFDSFEELQKYSNFGSARILGIKATGRSDDFKTTIIVNISREYLSLKRFGECSFEFASEDQYTVFRKEIQDFFEKCVEGEFAYQLGRWLFALALLGVVLFAAFKFINFNTDSAFLIIVFLLMLAGVAFWMSITFSTKVWDLAYPSIVFAIGEGVVRYEKFKKWRSNTFWGVIVAAAISFLVGLILK